MDYTINRRLNVLSAHLMPTGNSDNAMLSSNATNAGEATVDRYDTLTEGHTPTFDVSRMGAILRGNISAEKRRELFKIVDKPLMRQRSYNLSKEEHRKLVADQVKYLLSTGHIKITGMKTNPQETLSQLELGGILDASTGIKLGVQVVLFAGSIMNLGTKPHHDKYLEQAQNFELPGCFGMTELRHGSNVRKLETTATFDPSTQEFIVNTPNDGAVKWWIGNAQSHAVICSVFARLITQEKDYGIHAFLVPLRDSNHQTLPGVEIGDCGDKVGLHGVDNGFIRFTNVRIPRENLLNRFGDVMSDGSYKSEIQSEGKRFGAVLGELITGRVTLSTGSIFVRRVAITIATRYAAARVQFGPPKAPEIPILDYKSHQVRLMPILASCYAYEFSKRVLMEKYSKLHTSEHVPDDVLAEVHAMSAGMKAVTTWDTQMYLQTMRETCGGHGFSAYNKFGTLRDDHDVYQTFEGDNTVLVQQLAGYLLKKFAEQFQGNSQVGNAVTYLRMQMGSILKNRNPVITRISSKRHLRNSDFHVQAFEYRTAKLMERCATQIRANRKTGLFNAWNQSVPMMVQLGRAYVEQLTYEEFLKVVEAEEQNGDKKVHEVLKLLCDLFALSCIQKDIGNFLDLIKKNKARAIQSMVQKLCEEVRHHAVSLVDAFEIPDFIIDAPIGLSKGYYVDHILTYAKKLNADNHSFSVTGDKKPEKSVPGATDSETEGWNHDVNELHD